MQVRRSSKILIVAGVLFIVLAAVVRFFLVPALAKLPSDLDVSAQYEGTATMLDSEALGRGDVDNVIAKDVPVTLDRHIYVSDTDGNTAIAHDDVMLAAGAMNVPVEHTYAIDRKTMDATSAPDGSGAEAHSGITIALPLNPSPDTAYEYYDSATGTTVPMEYTGTSTVAGREVLQYRISANGPLVDPAILAVLPPALPKSVVGTLAPLLPADVQQSMGAALPTLADPVPFEYDAMTDIELSADAVTGAPIDATFAQQVIAGVSVGGQTASLMPVLAVDTALTPQSIDSAAQSASATASQLNLLSVIVPVAILVLGVVLILLGLLLARRRGKSGGETLTRTESAAGIR